MKDDSIKGIIQLKEIVKLENIKFKGTDVEKTYEWIDKTIRHFSFTSSL